MTKFGKRVKGCEIFPDGTISSENYFIFTSYVTV